MVHSFREALALLLSLPLLSQAQLGTLLGVPSLNSFTIQAGSSPVLFSIPPSGPAITISFSLCSDIQPSPRFFVSNQLSTAGPNDPSSTEVKTVDGIGTWNGQVQSGASLAAYPGSSATGTAQLSWVFEIGVQEGDSEQSRIIRPCVDVIIAPMHGPSKDLPLLGDTTSTQAIVFSPSWMVLQDRPIQTWPNYTLPAINTSYPLPPQQSIPPSSLLILATPNSLSSFPLFNSACALRQQAVVAATQAAYNATASSLVRDPAIGWQTEFYIPTGLQPSMNYSVWITQGPKIAGPIYILTKSASFSSTCTLVHQLPFCPLVAYPIPIAPTLLPGLSPSGSTFNSTAPIIDATSLPISIGSNVVSSLSNFSLILSTFPCGRDQYSPLHTCEACFDNYRSWACFVSFPRCTEPLPNSSSSSTLDQDVPFALVQRPGSSAPRSTGFPASQTAYTELLPCIETCNTVQRTCPPFLGWKCPAASINAGSSYALGVWDSHDGLGEGQGVLGNGKPLNATASVTDSFGRIWCNGP